MHPYFDHFQFLRWFFQDLSSLFIISIHLLFSILPVDHRRPLQVCALSIVILSMRISSMSIPLVVINLNWWRISIMWFLLLFHRVYSISFSGVVHHITFSVRDALSFLLVFQVSTLSHREAPSKSSQGFTLCFQLLFPFVWSVFCWPEFFMEALHEGS